jgi:hypothetical protein
MSIDMPFFFCVFIFTIFSIPLLYLCYTFAEGIGQEKRSEYVRLHAIRYLNAEQCHRALDYLSHGL